MTILVTGATGFIGTHLCKALESAHHQVVTEMRPGVDAMVHLAARTYVPESWEFPAGCLSTNVAGTVDFLELCRIHHTPFIFLSSYIYGPPLSLPVSEMHRLNPNTPYALSKHLAEQACAFYHRTYGIPITILRPFNVYGPGQDIRFLVPTIIEQVKHAESIQVHDLTTKRDYVYVEDVVKAILLTLDPKLQRPPYDVFNIGSGTSISVQNLIQTAQEVAGTQKPVLCDNKTRPHEVADSYADWSHARCVMGWTPTVYLKEGLARMLKASSLAESFVETTGKQAED